jgi:ribosomal protein S18 acetylase RimI-like enzyme
MPRATTKQDLIEAANEQFENEEDHDMSEIVKLSELDDNQLNQTVDVFIEGFYNVLKGISKDKEQIHKLFVNSFNPDMTYAYLHDGDALGFLGLANYQTRPVKLDKDVFIEVLGSFAGKMAYKSLSTSMEKINVHDPDEVCIDFIAAHPEHRSKGIGGKLVEYVLDNLSYRYIKLDVKSKNPRAIAFYERVGFKRVGVNTSPMVNLTMMLHGFGKLIIMRMDTADI